MVSLVAVLLAVSPLPGQASLLEPARMEPPPSARLLVAQQDPPAPLIVGIVSGLEASARSTAWRDGRAESFIPVAALSF